MDFLNWAERSSFLFLIGGLLAFGFVQGAQIQSFTIDLFFVVLEFSWVEAAFSNLSFSVFFTVSFLAYVAKISFFNKSRNLSNGRKITCIVPTYKDAEEMRETVLSILDSTYDNFSVIIVCVEGDQKACRFAKKLSEYDSVNFIVNTSSAGTKAQNVNLAIRETQSELLAIFDADQRIDPLFLGEAAYYLKEYQVVQGRNFPIPQGFVGNFSYYQELLFLIPRQIMRKITRFNLVTSSGVVFERDIIREVGYFDEDMLTEDIDFAFKCYKSRISSKNLLSRVVLTKPPVTIKDWWGQRKRWMTGYFQVFWKNFRMLKSSYSNIRAYLSVLICMGSLSGSFFLMILFSKFLLLVMLGANMIYLTPIASILVISLFGRLIDFYRNKTDNIGFYWIFSPFILPAFSLVTLRSFTNFIGGENQWYRVEK